MPKKRSKSPKRQKQKKKSSPSPPKTTKAGKRAKSKERKKSASRAKESPLIQTKRISIKATQVSEGSLENILQQLGGNNSLASLTVQTRESRGRSLARADRTGKVEPTIQSHIQKPLRSNSASDLPQMTNTETLRAQTTKKNAYRVNADQRQDYRENQKISEKTFAPRELFTGKDSEEFQEENIRTIQYEIVPPAKEFQQKNGTDTPRDSRYVKDAKEVKSNKDINQEPRQRERNVTPDTVEESLVHPLSRQNSGELKQTAHQDAKQEYQALESHSSHEVHKFLAAPKYPTKQQVQQPQQSQQPQQLQQSQQPQQPQQYQQPQQPQQPKQYQQPQQRNNVPESAENEESCDCLLVQHVEEQKKSNLSVPQQNVQQRNVPMTKDTTQRPDQIPKKQPDSIQQRPMPSPKEPTPRSEQIPRKLSDQDQPKALPISKDAPLRPDNSPRKQPDQAQSKPVPMTKDIPPRRPPDQVPQKNIPSSQESVPRSDNKLRRQPNAVQQRDIPSSQETMPRSNNTLRRQLDQEVPKAALKTPDMLPENTSKQSDDAQETVTANVLYKGALPNLVLYYDIMSPQARSCLMLICLLKLDVDLRYTDIFKGDQLTEEYLKINPVHTVPTLVTDDMVFTDSHTILMFLCDNSTNPLAKQLYPQSYLTRLKIMNCLFFEAQVLYRRHSNFMTDIVRKEFANIDYAFHEKKILEAYETLNSFLKESRYLVGDSLTIADISMVATISALDLMFPIDQYQNVWPELSNWFRSMRAIPMYRLNFAGVMKQGDLVEKYGKFEFNNKNNQ